MAGKIEQKVKNYLDKIKKEDNKINAFLEINKDVIQEARKIDSKKGKKGKLYGKVIAVKSNINVLGLSASCASKTLKDYKATYDASVIEKIKKEDGLIIGMTNCDEFAAGSSGEYSAFGPTINPACKDCVAGGSSSGSAAAVAADFCDMALGSDTGGSIRTPASFCGVVGMKPSYGAVSRYGLVDLSMSLDQIGPLAKNVDDAEMLFNVIKGKDDRDATSIEIKKDKEKNKKFKIGVMHIKGVGKEIQKLVDKRVENLVSKGWKKKEIEIKHVDLAIQTYHLLCWTEFFSSTRRFDGRKYGLKIEDFSGKEVLRRILGGGEMAKAEFAGRYYFKALHVKDLIRKSCLAALKSVDCIIIPTTPVVSWKVGDKIDVEAMYAVDSLAIPANLAGICSISIPAGFVREKPVGMQIMCNAREENKMLEIARNIEKIGFN